MTTFTNILLVEISIIAILLPLMVAVSKQRTNLKLVAFECNASVSICQEINCFLKPVSRSKTMITGVCKIKEPVNEAMVIITVEIKNAKNIYSVWLNQTANYCEKVGRGNIDFFGIVETLMNKVDPKMVQSCPVKGNFGSANLTIDSSVLDGIPVWTAATRNGRVTIKAYHPSTMEYYGTLRITAELKTVGA